MSSKPKAVALISGGLDSMLAAKVILQQGIEVQGLNFFTGFCHSGHTSAIRNRKNKKTIRNDALWVAETLNIKLHIVDIVEPYKEILINPKYGYGKNVNPCLDCKIFMIKQAYQWMTDNNYDFIITGEVIGQRPKSQRKMTMPLIAKESGAEDRLLRPLCAKHLPPPLPEREGWVNREALYDFHGRNRKPQLNLAQSFNIENFAQPAGGCCVLTDENYTRRLRDFWQYRSDKNYSLDEIFLLKVGRHLRLGPNCKLIIGRDEGENNFLAGYRRQFIHLKVENELGPLVLIDGQPQEDELIIAARVTARYASSRNAETTQVKISYKTQSERYMEVKPMSAKEVNEDWFL